MRSFHVDTSRFTDVELVQQLKNGRLDAGSALYIRHKQAVYSFCVQMLSDREAAKDATQETFLKMISKIATVDHGVALRSWLFSVARNEVLTILRRKKIVPMDPFNELEQAFDQKTPYHSTVEKELAAHVHDAIQHLKPAYREAYLLRELEGLSYDEIAAVTGTTLSAVKSKIFKSRAAMNEMLSPYMKENSP